MENSRTKNSLLNIISSFGGTLIYDIGYFFLRAVFVRTLAEEYLGLEGLFSNILGMLSLMELGIGPAMIVSLYRPIAEKNTGKIKSLMLLYRKAYTIIGVCVLIIGISLTPFLSFFIRDYPEGFHQINLIYFLYILNTGSSYFWIYKQSLFIADQKNYLVNLWFNAARIVMLLVQMLVLLLTHDFILFLVVQILFTNGANLFISRRADRAYPYLKDKNTAPLDSESRNEVRNYALSSTVLNIGSKLVNSTDQLIITRFAGLISGGAYSSYILVSDALLSIERKMFSEITASIGNLNVVSEREKNYEVFTHLLFASNVVSTVFTVCLYCLFQDFVQFWIGETFVLDRATVIIIVLVFYLYSVRLPAQTFNSATGAFSRYRYRAVVEGLINLIVSIVLVRKIGIVGVILGTAISCLAVPFWVEPYILFKFTFSASSMPYWRNAVLNLAQTAVLVLICSSLCALLPLSGLPAFLCKGLLCAALSVGLICLLHHRNESFAFFLQLVGRILKRARRDR